VVPSFSIHLSLCSTDFHRFPRYYEEIRFLWGRRPVVVASFGSTARADLHRPPWVRTLDIPPLPPPLPLRPRLDFGRRVRRHANPAGPACSGVHFRSVLRFASGFLPTRPRGASVMGVFTTPKTLRAVASSSRLLPTRPAKDFHLQSSAHARHTPTELRSAWALACFAHQLRNCQFAIEAGDAVFAPRMKALLLRAVILARRRQTLAASTRHQYRSRLDRDLDAIMALSPTNRHGQRLRKRYGKVRNDLFTFLIHPDVPPDNNGSERELRPTATYRKVTGGFRSQWGADLFASVRSVVGTAARTGVDAYAAILNKLCGCQNPAEAMPRRGPRRGQGDGLHEGQKGQSQPCLPQGVRPRDGHVKSEPFSVPDQGRTRHPSTGIKLTCRVLPEQIGAPDPERLDHQQGLHVREPARVRQHGQLILKLFGG